MINILKKQWFVILIALIFIGFSIFCIYDTNKGKLPGKSVDGKDVVASLKGDYNLTADELYEEMYKSSGDNLVMNRFRYAVANEAIKTTDELKKQGEQYKENFEANVSTYASYYGMTEEQYTSYVASANGFGDDELDDLFLQTAKMQKLQNDYITKHLDELWDTYAEEKKPRTVSHILIKMEDADNPTKEEQKKVDEVNKALKEGTSFAEVAKKYSDDTGSAENGGYLGFIDSDNPQGFVDSFMKAAVKPKAGETSEWVKESNDNYSGWHLIMVNETSKEALTKDEEVKEQLFNQIASYYPEVDNDMIKDAMKKLDISYESDEIKNMIKENLESEEK